MPYRNVEISLPNGSKYLLNQVYNHDHGHGDNIYETGGKYKTMYIWLVKKWHVYHSNSLFRGIT